MKTYLRPALTAGLLAVGIGQASAAGPAAQPSATPPAPVATPAAPPAVAPKGVWLDHTGRGAVEITDCNGRLCGQIVWLKDVKNIKGCGIQALSNVPPAGPGTWDGGWIYDPEENSKYDVEIKVLGPERLKVTGYLGAKFLGETFTWTRAPLDIVRCHKQ